MGTSLLPLHAAPDLPQRRGGGGGGRGERMKLQQPGLRLGIAPFRSSATQESGPASGTNPAAASGGGGEGQAGGPAAPQRGPGSGDWRGERTKKPSCGEGGNGSCGLPGQMETVSLRGAEPRRRGSPRGKRRGGRGARMRRHGTPRPPHRLRCPSAGRGPRSRPARGLPVPAARRGAGRQHPRGRASLAAAAPASRPGPAGTCPGCLLPFRGREPAALLAYRPVP